MANEQEKAVVLHSGGLDSTVLLYHLADLGYKVLPLTINYGQRHSREIMAASEICRRLDLPFLMMELSFFAELLKGGKSSQINFDVDVPEGHYSAENMAVTVVPNRNMVLLSIATAYAISAEAGTVAYAAHAGDHAQYPDCRREFIAAISHTISLCDDHPPQLLGPFATWSKSDIAARGDELKVPFNLTWSCYKGGRVHCGRCGTCVERAEAFYLAGVVDPTEYADAEYWKEVCGVDEEE
jgi:7-cyano-7-deazaguanine synthase